MLLSEYREVTTCYGFASTQRQLSTKVSVRRVFCVCVAMRKRVSRNVLPRIPVVEIYKSPVGCLAFLLMYGMQKCKSSSN